MVEDSGSLDSDDDGATFRIIFTKYLTKKTPTPINDIDPMLVFVVIHVFAMM